STHNLAAWNGTAWHSVAGSPDSSVHALLTFDDDGIGPRLPALYAGGDFTFTQVSTNHIARFDGAQWSTVGQGFNTSVAALGTFDEDGSKSQPQSLIAVGDFSQSGNTTVNRIATWDRDGTWEPLWAGLGMDNSVSSLRVVQGGLWATGTFGK